MKLVYRHKNNKGELACKKDEVEATGQEKGQRKPCPLSLQAPAMLHTTTGIPTVHKRVTEPRMRRRV